MNEQLYFQDGGGRPRDQHQLLVHAQSTVDNEPFPLCEGFPLVKFGGIVCHGYSSARISSGALYQFPPLCSSVDGILLRVSCIFVADGIDEEIVFIWRH